jgi:chromosome segregation ATPase
MAQRMTESGRVADAARVELAAELETCRSDLAAEQEACRSALKSARQAASAHADELEHRNAQATELAAQLQRSHDMCAALESDLESARSEIATRQREIEMQRREIDELRAFSHSSSTQLSEQLSVWRSRCEDAKALAGQSPP